MSTRDSITSTLGVAPDALVDYFDAGHFRIRPDSRIRCLSLSEALSYTQHVLRLPVGEHFGLFVLDDANDSNPYCFVSRGPCAGAVLHLMHDGDTHVAHRSLGSFFHAIDGLPLGADIDELPADAGMVYDTIATIRSLLSSEDEMDILVPIYLPVTGEIPADTKRDLAASEDFFVREAFADWLRVHGHREDLLLAERLSADRVEQVARPARQAVARLRRP